MYQLGFSDFSAIFSAGHINTSSNCYLSRRTGCYTSTRKACCINLDLLWLSGSPEDRILLPGALCLTSVTKAIFPSCSAMRREGNVVLKPKVLTRFMVPSSLFRIRITVQTSMVLCLSDLWLVIRFYADAADASDWSRLFWPSVHEKIFHSMRLSKQINLSILSSSSPARTKFGFDRIQRRSSIYASYIKQNYSFIRMVKEHLQRAHTVAQCRPLILSQTDSFRSRCQKHCSHIIISIYLHYLLRVIGGKERLKGAVATNTICCEQLGWKISAVRIRKLDKENWFLWHTLQWQAALQIFTIIWVERTVSYLEI